MRTEPASAVTRRSRRAARMAAAARQRRWLSLLLTPALVLATVGIGVWGATSAAQAAALPDPVASISLEQTGGAYGDADPKPFILAGEDAVLDVSLHNSSSTGGFNIAFTLLVPNGIAFGSSPMGAPAVYASGATLPNSATGPVNTVPAGYQLWVFEDVADLPGNADYASTITVRPDAAVFPVGASPDLVLNGYVSGDPAVKPIFDGSTGVGGATALAETSSGDADADVPVKALRLTKSEPSPEIELLRGVHDHQTVYTLTIENTPQGTTGGVTVVDYLPAGLEFLGCATVDNTQPSELLFDGAGDAGGTLEYPGSGDVTGASPADCLAPVSVETVDSGIPADLAPGVYTKVTWVLPDLSGTTAQSFPGAAGVPNHTTITYVAAVPLFENTMDFVTTDGSGTPATTGAQGSNLNNNNGPSTRQGQGAGFGDGIEYTNSATVSGTYAGPLASGASATVSDTDTERIQAMDLRVLKSVNTGSSAGDDQFDTGKLATYSLDLATGEYASADQMTVVDVIPNGLCPAFPASVTVTPTGDALPTECDPVSPGAGTPVLTNATVDSIVYDGSTGTFTVTFTPSPDAIAANGHLVISYTALMRPAYDTDDPWTGNTTSGDSLSNQAEITGWTHSIPAIADDDALASKAGVDEDVWDDSSAEIVSEYSGIEKLVLQRDAVIAGAPDAEASCDVADPSKWHENQNVAGDEPFHMGDVVCYQLTVDFATQIDVRNPLVTDFLPTGVQYVDWAIADATSAGLTVANPTQSGQRLDWEVGDVGSDGDRFVPLGSKLVLHVLGKVTSMSPNDEEDLDKPENLMKYQQENVLGDVFFLRDASAIQTDQAPTLLKGVRDVDGDATLPARSQNAADGMVFDSNRDGIQVVQGDEVTYRVDLTGGTIDVENMTVWDALPTGITKADVSASGSGTALDPSDAGYPDDPQYAGRSVIVWTGIDLAAAAQLSLTYTVTVPVGVLIDTDLDNTASITQYDVELNTGDTETFYPAGSLDQTPRNENVVPGQSSRDDSGVYTPSAPAAKTVVETEVGPATTDLDANNGNTQAVQGELITYQYSVTVPAHTSVSNGVLRDRGTLTPGNVPLTVTSGDWDASALTGADADDFDFDANPVGTAKGVLTFPESYTNSSDDPQVFTVTLTGYLGDAGNNNTTLTNQAQFRSDSWNTDATAQVVYREPNLLIGKSASPTSDVTASTDITYTLTVTNDTNRVKSYDNVVVDTVPAGVVVTPLSFSSPAPVSVDAGVYAGTGGTITWNIAEIPATATLSYHATIDPTTGAGRSYVNTATVTGYTLPSTVGGEDTTGRRGTRTSTDDATVTAVTAGIAKGVRIADSGDAYTASVEAPIGETVEYQVVATLYADVNYYAPTLVDTLPAGVTLDTASITGPTGVAGTWDRTYDSATNTHTWAYNGDILSAPADRTVTITYRALLSNAVAANVDDLDNTAKLTWLRTPGDTTRTEVTDDAEVDVLNPVLAIDKAVSNAAPDPGDTFGYTVTVTNTGDTAAYNSTITDTIPVGVVVDADTISGGGVLTGAGANGGGTITWTVAGPLHPQASADTPKEFVFTYSATLAPSATIGDAEAFTNTAAVTHFESFPTGGREYDPTDVTDTATVDPPFPHVTLAKTVTAGDTANAGTSFGWTLTLVNTGDGPAQTIAVTDVLPKNWTYDAGSARIAVGGPAQVALADPTTTTSSDVQTLVWSAAQISSVAPVLPGTASGATAPQRTIVITFTATPTEAALTDAGVTTDAGVPVPHTNTLSAVTTDTSGATSNEDGSYTGPDATANAYIHSADLQLVKDPGTGLVAGGPAGTAWTITVTNNGPDTAVGPFTVTDLWGDAGVLPAGFTVTSVAGTGWTCDTTTVTTGFTCVRTNAADTLAQDASFPVITVTAQASAAFDVTESPVHNIATVTSGTHDPEPDNDTDDADVPVTASADLEIVKTGPATAPNAGGSISWNLTVTNNGPSDSVSTTAHPITVTDTIPAGVNGVTVATLPAGWSANTTDPLDEGDLLTLTLADGQHLTPTQVVAFTLSGTVSPSFVLGDTIVNTAHVNPGETPDPDPDNNESTTPATTPTTDTTLGVTKTRQVFEGGAWRDATSADPAAPGAPVTYLVTVANTGTADAQNVTVVDEVPAYLAYSSFDPVTGTWTRTSTTADAGDDQAFALTGALVPAASASFRITLTIDPAHVGDVVNWVQADADNSTNSPRDDDDSDSTRSANLSIVKSHTGTATAGGTLPYTLTVTNEGPSYSSGPITIADLLPAGFGYESDTAEVSIAGGAAASVEPAVAGQTLTWTIGDSAFTLANGATIVVVFTATVDAAVPAGTYDNVGTVDGPDDTDPSDDSWTDPTPVTTEADLSILKTVAAGPYVAGEDVSYTLTVTNAGPSVARDVVVADTLPAGLTVTAMSGTDWTCDVAIATCERATLPIGTVTISVTAHIAASVVTDTSLTNVAEVTSSTPDPDPSDNEDDETITTTTSSDLTLRKTAVDADGAEIATAVAGTEVRYLLEVENVGPSDAVGPLTIADTLPAGFGYVRIADGSTAWTCAVDPADTQQLTCENPSGLQAGASATDLVIVVAIDPSQPAGDFANVATVTSPTPDPTPENNTDDATVTITQSADLSIVKTHDADAVRIGDELAFDLAVRNDGPSDATEVTVTDVLPAGLEYVDAAGSDPAWTVVASPVASDGTTTLTATLSGTLATGTAAPALTVTVLVQPAAYDQVVNVAEVTATQPDPDPSDNESEDPVTVPPLATLTVTKTAVGTFQVNEQATYRITVANSGPTEDPGPVVITDVLPAGLSYVSASGAGATCAEASGVVTCTLDGPLAVDSAVTLTLVVEVAYAAYPQTTNTATATTPTEQTPDAELSDTVTTAVSAPPLPPTGASIAVVAIAFGLPLLVIGLLLVARSRRRTV